jgi:hypothetical protein
MRGQTRVAAAVAKFVVQQVACAHVCLEPGISMQALHVSAHDIWHLITHFYKEETLKKKRSKLFDYRAYVNTMIIRKKVMLASSIAIKIM